MDVTFLTSSDSNIGPKAEKAVADALPAAPARLVDEINRAGRAGISLGDLKEALQKAWMPQNTVKGMRLHRYVAHFPAHFDVAGAAAVGKAFNKARVYPRAPVQPSPPAARYTVVPSAAAIAQMRPRRRRPRDLRSFHRRRPWLQWRPPPRRARATAAHRRGQGQGASRCSPPTRNLRRRSRPTRRRGTRHAPVATTRRWATLPSKQREAARFLGYVKAERTLRWSRPRRRRRRRRRRRWRRRRRRRPRRRPRRTRRRDRRQRRATRPPRLSRRHSPGPDELLRLGGDDGAAYRPAARDDRAAR